MLLFAAVAARDVGGARGKRQGNGVDRCFDVAEWHAFCLHPRGAGGRSLARSWAVDLVVNHNKEQVNVAAHGGKKLFPADPEAVPVATRHQYREFMIGKL